MYRIMLLTQKKVNEASTYQFFTEKVLNQYTIYEANTLEELDEKIEQLLNDEGYAKEQLVPVQIVDYKVSADIFEPRV